MAFDVEPIPDVDRLFRRVHREHWLTEQRVSSACFKKKPAMSVNWEKYSTAEETADANSAAVVSLSTAECRQLSQEVRHTPIEPAADSPGNRAHTEVVGDKPGRIANEMVRLAKLEWRRS